MNRWLCLLALCFPTAASVMDAVRTLPLTFEANVGQAERQYQFVLSRPEYLLLLQSSGVVVRHARGSIRIAFLGARRDVRVGGEEPLSATANYITGNRPARWLTSIPTFAKVRYRGVYTGVDLLFHGNGGGLEFDLVLAPGAHPSLIRLKVEGAGRIRIDEAGDLVIDEGRLRLGKPLLYQEYRGGRRRIVGGYSLDGGEVRLQASNFDARRPLVIDPVLSFSTYLGGSGLENGTAGSDMKGAAIATDPEGNVYVTGSTASADFAAPLKLGASETGSTDLFIAKFRPGGELIYSTRIGGSQLERGFGIAVDSAGNAYATGRTQSTDFPIVNAAQSRLGGIEDAYVLKLNPAGAQLLYSTFLGGSGTDFACGIAVDGGGGAYITGDTESPDLPMTPGALQRQYGGGVSDAFVARMAPAGALAYATYLGGRGFDHGESIAVDAAGNVYVTGYTSSADLPLARSLQSTLKGPVDAFVAKLNSSGSELLYSTYLGGADIDGGAFIAVDAAGSAHVTGVTVSTDFPTTAGVVQRTLKGEQDAFVTKLSPDGAMVFSTLLGGAKSDSGNGVALDGNGNVYVVGSTRSPDFPLANAVQSTHAGNDDVFVSRLNAAGSQLLISTFLGGSGWDLGWGIALDKSGSIYVTGRTDSADFPVLKAHQPTNKGDRDAFVARILDEAAKPGPFVTVSAASFLKGAGIAANSIASGFGEKLAAAVEAASTIPLPTSLAGAAVKVKDVAGAEHTASLFFVSPGQINYLIPEGSRPGLATVTVYNGEIAVATGTVGIERVAPALFAKNGDGKGVAAAMVIKVASDGRQTAAPVFTCGTEPGSCVPAPISLPAAGEQAILLLYGTGVRSRTSLDQVRVQIGGFQAEVQYAGAQNEYPGLDQINVKLPPMPNVRGRQAVLLTVEERVSNMVEISVEPPSL